MAQTRLKVARPNRPPLAVDLDGTLVHTDLFVEGLLRFAAAAPLNVFRLIPRFMQGRAAAKAFIARNAPCDPTNLPYDERVVAWIREEREAGRTVALATASDEAAATAVANHLGLFDVVLASDGRTNLKAQRKAEQLQARFPEGFVYAGNEAADLKIWRHAESVVVANASRPLQRSVERKHTVERVFPPRGGRLRALLKAIRPQQWAKNVLVFLPLLVGQGWLDAGAWRGAAIAFFALSAAASSVYLVNDAADIDADRNHARKRTRPFASGRLSPVAGLGAALALLVGGLSLGAVAGVLPLVLSYLVASSAYTFWLKRKMLVDVFLLAGLYMIRIVIGGVAASSALHSYMASSWLLAFSCFFFLSLALVKRFTEVSVVAASGGGDLARRGYRGADRTMLAIMGIGSGFVSSLVLALYLQSDTVASHYREPFLLWVLPAATIYWQCRLWLMADRGEVHDDPLVFASRDRISWVAAGLMAVAFVAAVLSPVKLVPWT